MKNPLKFPMMIPRFIDLGYWKGWTWPVYQTLEEYKKDIQNEKRTRGR